jgi:hypothetical protein
MAWASAFATAADSRPGTGEAVSSAFACCTSPPVASSTHAAHPSKARSVQHTLRGGSGHICMQQKKSSVTVDQPLPYMDFRKKKAQCQWRRPGQQHDPFVTCPYSGKGPIQIFTDKVKPAKSSSAWLSSESLVRAPLQALVSFQNVWRGDSTKKQKTPQRRRGVRRKSGQGSHGKQGKHGTGRRLKVTKIKRNRSLGMNGLGMSSSSSCGGSGSGSTSSGGSPWCPRKSPRTPRSAKRTPGSNRSAKGTPSSNSSKRRGLNRAGLNRAGLNRAVVSEKKHVRFSSEKKQRWPLNSSLTPQVDLCSSPHESSLLSPCFHNENCENEGDFLQRSNDCSWSHIPTTPMTPNVSFEKPDYSGYFPLSANKSKTRMALL